MMGGDVDVPALRPEEREIGDGRFGTGNEDECRLGRDRVSRLDQHHRDARLGAEWVEVVEVGDAREHGNGDDRATALRAVVGKAEHILRRKPARIVEPRHDTEAGPTGALGDQAKAVDEEAGVAAHLVDDEAANARAILR